jgi:SAM-dependent methyltransferase
MPFSSNLCKAEIRDWLRELRPATILDVGAGSGVYSRLFRPILPWATWVALEIHKPYVERYELKLHYERIIVSDVLRATIKPNSFDVVILGDVLEHMTDVDAAAALRRAWSWAATAVIASVPLGHCPQGASEGNEHEAHLSEWDIYGFPQFAHNALKVRHDASVIRKDADYTIGAYLWRK